MKFVVYLYILLGCQFAIANRLYHCQVKREKMNLNFSVYKEKSVLEIKTPFNGQYICESKTLIEDKRNAVVSSLRVEMRLKSHCLPELPDFIQKNMRDFVVYEQDNLNRSKLHFWAFADPSECE